MSLSSGGNIFGGNVRRVNILTAMVLANRERRAAPVQDDRDDRRAQQLEHLQRELDGVPGIGSSAVAGEQAGRARRATGRLT